MTNELREYLQDLIERLPGCESWELDNLIHRAQQFLAEEEQHKDAGTQA